jgi:glycosyltransferase involved in cell wall biosynthesis
MVARHLGFAEPILWLYYTEVSERLIGHFGEKLAVCDVFDKYSAFPSNDAWSTRRIKNQESSLLLKSDLVFAVSQKLCAYCRRFNESVFLVPNAVDLTLWDDERPKALSSPPPLNLKHPVLGYVGAINDKVDLKTLLGVSAAYPEASVLLVGPVGVLYSENLELLSQLEARPNVFFLGRVPRSELCAHFTSIDIALLPYAPIPHVAYGQPNKLFEYLAAGKPIVALDTVALEDCADVVLIAHNTEQFVQHIGHLLTEDTAQRVQAGRETARRNTWDERVARISEVLDLFLCARGK